MSLRRLALLLLALALLGQVGCQTVAPARPAPTPSPSPTSEPSPTPAPPTPTRLADGQVALVIAPSTDHRLDVSAELAITPPQRSRGLMYRDSLVEGTGMLFVFPGDTESAFWMENTKVPLSIAFIDADGVVVGLDDMQPLSRALHNPPGPYRYALEVAQGLFASQGVRVGDRVYYQGMGELLPLAQLPATGEAS
ncbi:MAG: DUF192 domain-containing protein [Dehalococcoidales bacterium]|nr:DUF192 domain-containing protein [Dehalococcoidales bacterium]